MCILCWFSIEGIDGVDINFVNYSNDRDVNQWTTKSHQFFMITTDNIITFTMNEDQPYWAFHMYVITAYISMHISLLSTYINHFIYIYITTYNHFNPVSRPVCHPSVSSLEMMMIVVDDCSPTSLFRMPYIARYYYKWLSIIYGFISFFFSSYMEGLITDWCHP